VTQNIPMLDVVAQNAPMRTELEAAFARTLDTGRFIMGPEVVALESDLAEYVGAKHAIGVSSGTDALLVSLMALGVGPGDEVITTPFTFFATGGCIARLGATPVFVDIRPDTFNLDESKVAAAITPKTRAVVPVHLYGQSCDMGALQEACGSIPIIEDAAQSLGSRFQGKGVGSIGTFGCFSFFPSKNLGALGDGGLITTNDDELAERARVLRAHGSKPKYFHALVGGNFRLDALQASLLRVKFPRLDGWAEARRTNAAYYTERFNTAGLPSDRLSPPAVLEEGHVFNQYVIRTDQRDPLAAGLKEAGIESAIYYPRALHMQECFRDLGYAEGAFPIAEKAAGEVLAIPVYPELGDALRERVADTVIRLLR
jgi:dTDP-4-amino-4,6-dideoxygalactose transaminase